MDREEFIDYILTKGKLNYIQDTYGNLKATRPDGTIVRYKIQKNSVRHEKQYSYEDFEGHMKNDWTKMWSEYYKNLEVNPETGGLRRIKK